MTRALSIPRFAVVSAWVGGMVLVLAVLVAFPASSLARKGKGKKHRKPRSTHAKADPNRPNFLLEDWLFEARVSTASRSSGKANRGSVYRSEKMDLKGRSWKFLPAIKERQTHYGTFALVRLIESAGDAVAEQFPGTYFELGNMGRRDGGAIQQSKSHQGGRDVDVAFPARDAKGRYRLAGRMLKFNSSLQTPNGWSLDLERTWAFVAALVASESPAVQWIFVSSPIRTALLAHARKVKAPKKLIKRASVVLHQPGDSAPHNDHMHVRIFCDGLELASGCVDYGPIRNHLVRDNSILSGRGRHLARKVRKGLTNERLTAFGTLLSLSTTTDALVKEMLCDPDSKVVKKALTRFQRTHRDTWDQTIVAKLTCAGSPEALTVLFQTVSSLRHRKTWKMARKILAEKPCTGSKGNSVGARNTAVLCAEAARSLGYAGNPEDGPQLAALLKSSSKLVRRHALRALRTLYATRTPYIKKTGKKSKTGDKKLTTAEIWMTFARSVAKQKWSRVVLDQLLAQGTKLTGKLYDNKNVDEMIRLAGKGYPVSYTAQVVLSKLLNHKLLRPLEAHKAVRLFRALAKDQLPESQHIIKASAKSAQTRKNLPPLPTLD
jgi:murein endopeptidase